MTSSKDELTNDMVSVVATITDSILEFSGIIPIAGKIVPLWKTSSSVRAAFFERKVIAFWEDFQNPAVDKALLANVYIDFRTDYGADYFDEALFNAIEKSDSVKRTKMISSLIILCSLKKIPQDEFWAVLYVIQNLTMDDFMRIENAIALQRELNTLKNDEFTKQTHIINEQIGMSTLLRFQACALAMTANIYGGSRVPFVNIPFAELVLDVVSYDKSDSY